jgi:hypothetical protein
MGCRLRFAAEMTETASRSQKSKVKSQKKVSRHIWLQVPLDLSMGERKNMKLLGGQYLRLFGASNKNWGIRFIPQF